MSFRALHRTNCPFWLFAALEQLLAALLVLLEVQEQQHPERPLPFFPSRPWQSWDAESPEESERALAGVREPERERRYQNSPFWWGGEEIAMFAMSPDTPLPELENFLPICFSLSAPVSLLSRD